jgi:hypothetical protein
MSDTQNIKVQNIFYRWRLGLITRFVTVIVIAWLFAYGVTVADAPLSPHNDAGDGMVFISLIVPGLLLGCLVVALPGWILRANRNSTERN